MILSTIWILEPKTATIPPTPFGTELCMAFPLIFNIFKVSLNDNDPAEVKAEYSPNECPAKKFALFKSILNSSLIVLKIE